MRCLARSDHPTVSVRQDTLQVFKELGRYEDSFLDLQRLQSCTPELTGLFEKLQEAAACCLAAHGAPGAANQACTPQCVHADALTTAMHLHSHLSACSSIVRSKQIVSKTLEDAQA